MLSYRRGSLEIVRSARRSASDVYLELSDRAAAEVVLRQFRGDCAKMSQLRAVLAETKPFLSRLSDDDVIQMLASQLAAGQLLVKAQTQLQRPMTGYFTMMKSVFFARSFEELEDLAGYRRGRISAKGLLIYRFLRLPEITEFEVRGSTITPEHV